MKKFISALAATFVYSSLVHAMPVLNKNAAVDGSLVTIWPDHKIKDLYYYAPSSLRGSYREVSEGNLSGMLMQNVSEDTLQSMNALLKTNPQAWFEPVPMKNVQVSVPEIYANVLTESKCRSLQDALLVACDIQLDPETSHRVLPLLRNPGLIIEFRYQVEGVVGSAQLFSRRYKTKTVEFSIPLVFKTGSSF